MPARNLGALEVSAQGLGCMGLSELRGKVSPDEGLAIIRRAVELGITFFDTANIYGAEHANEKLLAKALGSRRDGIVVATKFGVRRESADFDRLPGTVTAGSLINNQPGYIRSSCVASLRALNADAIDLLFVHRVDPVVPIEETVGVMAELVLEGKVRYIGLSEVAPDTIRRGHAVHPITAVESEYSLWTRGIEHAVIPTCRSLGIGIVPYSPLGRGFLAAGFKSRDELDSGDLRQRYPWFSEKNFAKNQQLAARLSELAQAYGCTPAQLALAWLSAQGDDIVPIPGAELQSHVEENAAATGIELTAIQAAQVAEAVPADHVAGTRYADMSSVAGQTRG